MARDLRGLGAEPRCLWAMEWHGQQLANLSRPAVQAAKPREPSWSRRCLDFGGCAAAALRVEIPAAGAYVQRIQQAFPALAVSLGAFARWIACVPTACLALGTGPLLRAVLARLLFGLLLGAAPPLPDAPFSGEVKVRVLGLRPEPNDERGVQNDKADEEGECICSGEMHGWKGYRYVNGPKLIEYLQMMRQQPRREALQRVGLISWLGRVVPERLARHFPKKCYNGQRHTESPTRDCTTGHLNSAILQAVLAFYSPVAPRTFLARIDDVVILASLMADCPLGALGWYAGTSGIAPLPGFTLEGAAAKVRWAHHAFMSGRKLLGDPLDWGGGAAADGPPRCDADAADRAYASRAAAASLHTEPLRVACLYLAVLPEDVAQVRLVGRTFARHCDWAHFFTSSQRTAESRATWRLSGSMGGHLVVNLARVFEETSVDEGSFMKTDWEGSQEGTFKRRWWSGNTIQKSLLILLWAADQALDKSDVFCLLELDSAFSADNLRAFVRAAGIRAVDPVFIAGLNMGMKLEVGVFPHTAGGICITRESLRRVGKVLEAIPRRAIHYEWPSHKNVYVPHFSWRDATPGVQFIHGCGFVAGHWWDVMMGRCLVAANVSVHPAIEDGLGRYYFSTSPMPCLEHERGGMVRSVRSGPPDARRLQHLAWAYCQPMGFVPEYHRYAPCEPQAVAANADYWLSPFAIGFHSYKNLTHQRHAYRILYKGASCTWANSYRPRLAIPGGH